MLGSMLGAVSIWGLWPGSAEGEGFFTRLTDGYEGIRVPSSPPWEKEEASPLKILRVHGSHPKYFHRVIGGNFRLDALQAAILLVKLQYLEGWTSARRRNARRYGELFSEAGLDDSVRLPVERNGRHIYNQFVIGVGTRRDALRQFLQESEVGTEIYYPVPMHLQPCFAYLNYKKGLCPRAETAAETTLALPVYPELTDRQQAYVVDKIKKFYSM